MTQLPDTNSVYVEKDKLADLVIVARWVVLSFAAGLKDIPASIAADAASGLSDIKEEDLE